MTPAQRRNLQRLLAPRSIAVIGGGEAAASARNSAQLGFDGPIWGVNPKRDELGGYPCFASVSELPGSPDAVFLAVPRWAVIDTLAELHAIGAGGAVCYTAGFREIGAEGAELERAMIEAAGDVAVVGPNCFGVLAPVTGAALWAYDHGVNRLERGVALVSQSGMLASNLTMTRRALPMAYVISAGNQSVLGIEDYVDVLVDDPAVTAIGLYVEELRDIPRFVDAGLRAAAAGMPIVALKVGTSKIAASLTVTHTGSLSGADEVYQALFDRLGVIRVDSPVMLAETLKMLTLGGVPKGYRVAAFTGSGGDAAMLADHADELGLDFVQPGPRVAEELKSQLPDIATLSNPLDYTTELWGVPDKLERLIATMLRQGYDAAMIMQDYPVPVADADRTLYDHDTNAFLAATNAASVPAAICSVFPENLDRPARERILAGGAAPLQGMKEALTAIAAAARYGERRAEIMAAPQGSLELSPPLPINDGETTALDEWQGKRMLADAGVTVPEGRLVDQAMAGQAADELGYPVVVKLVDASLSHKSELGAVRLGLGTRQEVEVAVAEMAASTAQLKLSCHQVLVERMVQGAVAEVLVGIRQDEKFGAILVVGSGGILVELMDDTRTLLLPATRNDIARAVAGLKVSRLFDGYRGKPPGDLEALVSAIISLCDMVLASNGRIAELEVNPLMVTPGAAIAVDVLARVALAVDPGPRS